MNERIRELAEQTKVFMDGSDDLDIFIEKFAELIVKECVQVALETIYNRGIGDGQDCAIVGNAVAEHFGVEE
jgi:hypothetical protein